MRWLAHLVGLALALAACTWLVAWWTVPVIAAVYGVWQVRARAAVWTSTLAGALAWAALLGFDASRGPVGRLSALLGDVTGASHGTFAGLTIAYAALLCAAAASFARSLRRLSLPTA